MHNNAKGTNSYPQSNANAAGKSRNSGKKRDSGRSKSTRILVPGSKTGSSGSNREHTNSVPSNSSGSSRTTPPDVITRYQSVYSLSRADLRRMLQISYPGIPIKDIDVVDLAVLMDCWISVCLDLMVVDYGTPLVTAIVNTGLQIGIVDLIKSADVSAENLIKEGISSNCCIYPFDSVFDRWLQIEPDPSTHLWRILQVLRFPKRYSPSVAKTYYEDQTLQSYLELDNRVWQRDQSHRRSIERSRKCYACANLSPALEKEPYGYIGSRLRAIIYSWMKDYKNLFARDLDYDHAIARLVAEGRHFSIPTGSTSDCGLNKKKKCTKFLAAACVPGVIDPIPDSTVAQVLCVNKSYKTPRTIAKEPMKRALLQKEVRKNLIRALESKGISTTDAKLRNYPMFHFDDQSVNRWLCYSTDYATLDASNASDSISWDLIQYLFPPALVYDLEFVRSSDIVIRGKNKRINKAFTSGAGCCFEVESIFFGAVLFLALELHSTWTKRKTVRGIATVYGDDMIISRDAAELAIQLLTLFGIDVNDTKSHYASDDPYRETCGIEVYAGNDVSSIFYPRKTVIETDLHGSRVNTDRTANILAKLQNRLYDQQYKYACMTVSQIVRQFKPGIRFSPVDMEAGGLKAERVMPWVHDNYFSKPNPLLPIELRDHLYTVTIATTLVESDREVDDGIAYYMWLYNRGCMSDPRTEIPFKDDSGSSKPVYILPDKAPVIPDGENPTIKLTNRVVSM